MQLRYACCKDSKETYRGAAKSRKYLGRVFCRWASSPQSHTGIVEPDHHRHGDHPTDRAHGIYGVISNKAHGHVVTTILIAMVAMLFTAISYGRMARVYPSAGSAYTYVGQEMHSALGYVVGWAW